MPADYVELERRVDALKQVHQKMLQVTYVRDEAASTVTDRLAD
jgi:hypothetical protein